MSTVCENRNTFEPHHNRETSSLLREEVRGERAKMRFSRTDDCYTKLQEQRDKEAALTLNMPSLGPN